jgi:ribonuclease BN (tRNA processing enzyme)
MLQVIEQRPDRRLTAVGRGACQLEDGISEIVIVARGDRPAKGSYQRGPAAGELLVAQQRCERFVECSLVSHDTPANARPRTPDGAALGKMYRMASGKTSTLTLLGTQGWIPTPQRHTTCLAFQAPGRLLLFDAGTGLSRLLQEPLRSAARAAAEVHLFLTHYHLDHTVGLSYLTGLLDRKLTVHVPEQQVNGVDPQGGVPALIRHPFFPVNWADQASYSLQTLAAGDNEVAGMTVRVKPQCHPDTTVAYRVDDLFAFATDTVADPETAAFARGAQVLLHESWLDGAEEHDPSQADFVRRAYTSHTSARQAASIAVRAGVEHLYLVHLNPLLDEDYYRRMERSAREIFPGSSVPADLHVHQFSG